MNSLTSTFTLHNGVGIHCVGYGTFLTPPAETKEAVLEALKVGYRHVDTAACYKNEEGVGQAIAACGIPREELFITSKVWNTERGYEKTMAAFEETMKKLGLEYLDLYLIHWPANKKQFGDQAKILNQETWRALEDLYLAGRIKSIGISNFMPHHIEELMETARIKPMVNQIEVHPGWLQEECCEYCKKNDILVEAWSPLGRKDALENEGLKAVAAKYGVSVAQLCIRWVLQKDMLPLPKTVTPSRMVENADVFGFVISKEDMAAIDAMDVPGGQCALPDEVDF